MSGFPLVDAGLVARIERAGVDDLCAWVTEARESGVYPDAAAFRVAGGAAVWFSPSNVVNGSFGLGIGRPVEQEEVAALVAFFAERGAPAKTDVCPHADPSLTRWLAEAGFLVTDFETVLYQPLPAEGLPDMPDGIEVRVAATAEDRALWADLEARGFADDAPSDGDRALSDAISRRPGALPFLGYLDGEAAGTGMLNLVGGTAMFNGDSTLSVARGRGVQTALLAERLRYAAERGCDLAVIEADSSGGSQRNQLRAGFRVAYTRVCMELPKRV